MAALPLTNVLDHVRALAGADPSDRQLLQRFTATADEAAFAALVRRHGPVVLGVCRRVLGAGPDVDDAFQATFVVLARKAGSIRKHNAVGGWLYGVAYRLALQVRTRRSRRQRRERLAGQYLEDQRMRVEPATSASLRELGAILDEELGRLPAACRDALVLCHLEGLSHTEAAHEMGCPLGTLKGRLQRGRDLLRKRLQRRGVALSSVALALTLAEQARAAVPAGLARATLRCASPSAVPPRVAALANGALAATRLKVAAVAVLAVGVLGLAVSAAQFEPGDATAPPVPLAIAADGPPVGKDAFGDALPPGALARLGTVRWRHGGPVCFVAMLEDGKRVISAANDRYVRVWDAATGTELHRFGPGPKPSLAVGGIFTVNGRPNFTLAAVSADGKLVAGHFEEPLIQLWNTATGKEVGQIPLPREGFIAGALAFAPDGKHLAVAGINGTVRLWDLAAGKVAREMGKPATGPQRLVVGRHTVAVFSPDGKTLVSVRAEAENTDAEYHLEFWDPETGQDRFTVRASSPFGIGPPVFSPDGKLFAYALGGEVTVLDATNGRLLEKLKLWNAPAPPFLAFAADSASLYTLMAGGGAVHEWDIKTARERRLVAPDIGLPVAQPLIEAGGGLTLSPDGKTLATGGVGNTIRFLEVATGKERPAFGGHWHTLQALSYSPDGKAVMTGGADQTVRLWDPATGRQTKEIPLGEGSFEFAVSADGRYLAVEGRGSAITVTDSATGKKLFALPAHPGFPKFFFSPDGHTLVVRRLNQTVAVLYDVPSGKERCRLSVATEAQAGEAAFLPEVVQCFFSPDSKRLGAVSSKGPLTIFDAATGRVAREFRVQEKMAVRTGVFSPNGLTIALGEHYGLVHLVELATGQEVRTFGENYTGPIGLPGMTAIHGFFWNSSAVARIAFSPDGRLLAHAAPGKAVRVWDVATGRELATFLGHQAQIDSVAFAPDGRTLASGSDDTTALIWDVRGLSAKAGPVPRVLDAAAVKAHWAALAANDAVLAAEAANALVGSPRETLAFLKTQLQPTPAAEGKRIAVLLEQLNSEQFKVRQKAQAELEAVGEQLVPYLDKALADNTIALEGRRRLEVLHAKVSAPVLTGERLRLVRAIDVVERIGDAEARGELRSLADGAPGALATTQARAALRRLGP